MEKIRSFIAIAISEEIRQKITIMQDDLKKYQERISWTRPANIHLTLRFLGDVEERKLKAIGESLTTLATEFQPFVFSVRDLGAFPDFKRPRVLWLGVENPTDELKTICSSIEEKLQHLGFAKEKRKFNPHLTIGRVKAPVSNNFIRKFKASAFDGEAVTVEEIILMKSDLHPGGAIYTPLTTVRLGQI